MARHTVRRVSFATAVAVMFLAAPRVGAAPFLLESGAFGINCTGTGQLCAPPYTLAIGDPVRTIKVKKIVYTAAAEHCSAGRLHVSLDGVEVGRMRFVIGRERSVLRKRLRLAPGAHALAFQFEGKTGGCNVGSVSGWGGAIAVEGRQR